MSRFTLGRRAVLAGTAGLGVAALFGSGSARSQGTADLLRYRVFTDMQVLDPPFRLTKAEEDVMSVIYPRLISFAPGDKWQWQPDAAEVIEQIDEKKIHFKLRRGLKWTNGFGEVTAEDVKFSFERTIDPKLDSPYKDDWSALDHVEVTGTYEGNILLKQYFAPLWWSTLPWGSGSILSKKAVESVGGRFTSQPPATCGPYMWKEWKPKQKLVLAKDPNWSGKPGAFDKIWVIPIEDEKSAEVAIEAGDLDYTTTSLSSLKTLRAQHSTGMGLLEKPSLGYTWLGMNTGNPALSDIRVRQAIRKAIDVDQIIQGAYFDAAKRSTGIVAPGLMGHRNIEPPKRDLEGAKKLLAEAGAAAPKTLTLDVLNTTELKLVAQIAQANLAELDIAVQINEHDGGTFWTLGDEKAGNAWKSIQLVVNFFTMAPDPSWATAWFTCKQVGIWNWERWCNKEFSDMHQALLAERDNAKRDTGYQKMQDMMEASGAYVFITHGINAARYRDSIVPATLPDGSVRLDRFTKA
ncbi:MAG: peptide/nickel transport system substrate-binding protein [Rhodospirillaceae bacterium]|jgi:peptide/nickel transport system substrate-binding protein|nr:peptide/nickel transport system substrate-binding protein [Rhodospirillaceae bacterium]